MGQASRKSDVFSFGIMLLEVFTGKSRNDAMFAGELNLRQWVCQACPATLADVLDDKLAQAQGEGMMHLCLDYQTNGSLGSCSASTGKNLLVPMFELGLVCSSESPDQSPSMNDVVVCLKNIKKGYSAPMPTL